MVGETEAGSRAVAAVVTVDTASCLSCHWINLSLKIIVNIKVLSCVQHILQTKTMYTSPMGLLRLIPVMLWITIRPNLHSWMVVSHTHMWQSKSQSM